eukprot:192379_1
MGLPICNIGDKALYTPSNKRKGIITSIGLKHDVENTGEKEFIYGLSYDAITRKTFVLLGLGSNCSKEQIIYGYIFKYCKNQFIKSLLSMPINCTLIINLKSHNNKKSRVTINKLFVETQQREEIHESDYKKTENELIDISKIIDKFEVHINIYSNKHSTNVCFVNLPSISNSDISQDFDNELIFQTIMCRYLNDGYTPILVQRVDEKYNIIIEYVLKHNQHNPKCLRNGIIVFNGFSHFSKNESETKLKKNKMRGLALKCQMHRMYTKEFLSQKTSKINIQKYRNGKTKKKIIDTKNLFNEICSKETKTTGLELLPSKTLSQKDKAKWFYEYDTNSLFVKGKEINIIERSHTIYISSKEFMKQIGNVFEHEVIIDFISNCLSKLNAIELNEFLCNIFAIEFSHENIRREIKNMQQNKDETHYLSILGIFAFEITVGCKIVIELNNKTIINPLHLLETSWIGRELKSKNAYSCMQNLFDHTEQVKIYSDCNNPEIENSKETNVKVISYQSDTWEIAKRNLSVLQLHAICIGQIKPTRHMSGKPHERQELLQTLYEKNERYGIEIDIPKLSSYFVKYDEKYKKLVKDDINTITSKARKFKKKNNNAKDFFEALALVSYAFKLTRKFPPRDAQLITIILAFTDDVIKQSTNDSKGRFYQVGTGEGKTWIVTIFAILMYLFKNSDSIDVFTSQSLLAKDQNDSEKEIYKLFNMKNNYVDPSKTSPKQRKLIYEKDTPILYGTAFQYECDELRKDENIRSHRQYDVCIIDEVDNLLIDNILSSVRLSSPTAGMKTFNLLFLIIWNRLKNTLKPYGEFYFIGEKLYCLSKQYTLKNEILASMTGVTNKQDMNDKEKDEIIFAFIVDKILSAQTYACADTESLQAFLLQFNITLKTFYNEISIKNYFNDLLNNSESIETLLHFISHVVMLNIKVALYDIGDNNELIFKAYFESGSRKIENIDPNICDILCVQSRDNVYLLKQVPLDAKTQIMISVKKYILESVMHFEIVPNEGFDVLDHDDNEQKSFDKTQEKFKTIVNKDVVLMEIRNGVKYYLCAERDNLDEHELKYSQNKPSFFYIKTYPNDTNYYVIRNNNNYLQHGRSDRLEWTNDINKWCRFKLELDCDDEWLIKSHYDGYIGFEEDNTIKAKIQSNYGDSRVKFSIKDAENGTDKKILETVNEKNNVTYYLDSSCADIEKEPQLKFVACSKGSKRSTWIIEDTSNGYVTISTKHISLNKDDDKNDYLYDPRMRRSLVWNHGEHYRSQFKTEPCNNGNGLYYIKSIGGAYICFDTTHNAYCKNGKAGASHFSIVTKQQIKDAKYVDNNGNNDNKNTIFVPSFLKPIVLKQINFWMQSAWEACITLKENKDYLIKYGEIKLIDKQTGTVLLNSVWQHGLHQFLELKHNLKMREMGFAAITMTQSFFFHKYNKLYGLSGTLGADSEIKYYKKAFGVECVLIPEFTEKPLIKYNDILCSNTNEWIQTIILSTFSALKAGRGVLIICSDIEKANKIEDCLYDFTEYRQYLKQCVKYTRDDVDDEKENIKNELQSGQVIVATNLAGRGSDIKLSKDVIKYGGLKVIITFQPDNNRIRWQNIGRVSRSGTPGSSVIIINQETCKFCDGDNDTITKINDLTKCYTKKYMDTLGERLDTLKTNEEVYREFTEFVVTLNKENNPNVLSTKVLSQIYYLWSVVYQDLIYTNDESEKKSKFEKFKNKIKSDLTYKKFKICYNPYHLINQ